MLEQFKANVIANLIRHHPKEYLKIKGIGTHPLGKDYDFLKLHASLIQKRIAIMRLEERYNLWILSKSIYKKKGSLAEVGVYSGGSAKILCETKGHAPLYLFDTFAGIPNANPKIDGVFKKGDFADGTLIKVKKLLSKYHAVNFYPGIFPKSAASLNKANTKFKFVNIDVDVYKSTYDVLEWFYPKMIKGGIMITHDYGNLTAPGVKKAFDKFFANKPEVVVPLWYSQAVVIKI